MREWERCLAKYALPIREWERCFTPHSRPMREWERCLLLRKNDLFLVLQAAVGEEGGRGEDEDGGEDEEPEESLQYHAPHQACNMAAPFLFFGCTNGPSIRRQ